MFERASEQPLAAPLLLVLTRPPTSPRSRTSHRRLDSGVDGLQLVTVFQDVARSKTATAPPPARSSTTTGPSCSCPGSATSTPRSDQPAHRRARDRPRLDHHRHHGPPIEHGLALAPAPAPRAGPPTQDGEGVLLYGNLPSIRVRLRPWYRNRALRRRANHPEDALAAQGPDTGAPAPPHEPTPPRHRPSCSRSPPLTQPPNVSPIDAAQQRHLRRPGIWR